MGSEDETASVIDPDVVEVAVAAAAVGSAVAVLEAEKEAYKISRDMAVALMVDSLIKSRSITRMGHQSCSEANYRVTCIVVEKVMLTSNLQFHFSISL